MSSTTCLAGPTSRTQMQDVTHQVVANLMSNAIKFTPRGKRIELRVEERNGSIVLVVADQGIGMKSDAIDASFKEGRTDRARAPKARPGPGSGSCRCSTSWRRMAGASALEPKAGGRHARRHDVENRAEEGEPDRHGSGDVNGWESAGV